MISINTKEEREALKNKAVETREAGKLQEALEMFKAVEVWDEKNANKRGLIDVLGHIRIVLTRLADEVETTGDKKKYARMALDVAEKALRLGDEMADLPEGAKAVQKIHMASALFGLGMILELGERTNMLGEALTTIEDGIRGLSGSKAHRAWPAATKARILYETGNKEDAVTTLLEGERLLFEGYDDEIARDDQAEIKLNVWLVGMHLAFAEICQRENKPILAKHYASSVIAVDDPKNILGERKKEARRILDSLKS